MSFNSKLVDLLKTDHNLADDEGELLIAAVQYKVSEEGKALNRKFYGGES